MFRKLFGRKDAQPQELALAAALTFLLPTPANALAWSPDSQQLAIACGNSIITILNASRQPITIAAEVASASEPNGVAWSAGGCLAYATQSGVIHIYNLATKTQLELTGHAEKASTVAWSPDGQLLASGSDDATVRLWRSDGQPLATLDEHWDRVSAVVWSPDGRTLASASGDSSVWLWRPDGTSLAKLSVGAGSLDGLAWSPDSRQLAVASESGTLRLWDVEQRKVIGWLNGYSARVKSVSWSPDGRHVAAASTYHKWLYVWDVAQQQVIAKLHSLGDSVTTVAWSPDGRHIAAAAFDGGVAVWAASAL